MPIPKHNIYSKNNLSQMIEAVLLTQQAIDLKSPNKFLNLLSININSSQDTKNTIKMKKLKDHEHQRKIETRKRNY